MKKTSVKVAAILFPLIATANTEISVSDVVQPDVNSSSEQHAQQSFSIEGIKILLSPEDRHMAKQFGLSENQYAQYKYIVEHTPRKFWSPDIDPVTALGTYASTEAERRYYAEIAYQLHVSRESSEIAFAKTAKGVEKAATPTDKRWLPNNQLKFGFAQTLPGPKTSLTSAFVNAGDCNADASCRMFIDNLLATNSSLNKLDLYFTDISNARITDFVATLNIERDKFESGSITINREEGVMAQNNLNYSLPFAVTESNLGSEVHQP